MNVSDLLRRSALAHPGNPAVVHHDRRMSYRELAESTVRVADYLKRQGLKEGDRVALLFENSIDYVVLFFGVLGAGGVVVPLDTSLGTPSLAGMINDCRPGILMFQSKFRGSFAEIVTSCPSLRLVIADQPLPHVDRRMTAATLGDIMQNSTAVFGDGDPTTIRFEKDPERPHRLAAIFYTSGSTGTSKGVMLSHLNLVSNTMGTAAYLKLGRHDSVLVVLPFYYIYGNSLLLTHVAAGGTLVIDNRFMYPEVILDTMERERVTGFSGVPSNFMILLNKSTFATRRLPNLRYFTQAGGAMAPEVVRRLMEAFPDKEIYIMYGQTEASPRVSYLPPERLKEKLGSIGVPVPGVTIAILNEQGEEVMPGEVGEIVVSGDNVMMGYWNQPAEQEAVLRSGRLYTGDLARRDEEGLIYIVGRKKEIIKTGGNRVSAKEVEECLLAHESVAEAAVFGVDDPILGEAITAAVVLRDGRRADHRLLQAYCKGKLADYKVPRRIRFLEALPKYQSGKVNKLLLKESGQH